MGLITECLIVFVAQFFYVFLLGFQSRNVRDGQYLAAAMTSMSLGVCGIAVQPLLIKSALIDPEPIVLVSYVAAGPIGICFAMWFHDFWNARKRDAT